MKTYQVRDGMRLISFSGEVLGESSSRRAGVYRWTDMTLFHTEGGSYVLEKVGRSVMCHDPSCTEVSNLPRFQVEYPGKDPDIDEFQYHECVPEEYDYTTLLVEENRYWALVTKDPHAVVQALQRWRDGVVTLPRISKALLEEVATTHPEFNQYWQVEHIA